MQDFSKEMGKQGGKNN